MVTTTLRQGKQKRRRRRKRIDLSSNQHLWKIISITPLGQPGEKYFDYFAFKIVNCGLPRSGAHRRALAQTIGNGRGLDINSPLSAKTHAQDPRFC
jgi:hypothetical protein